MMNSFTLLQPQQLVLPLSQIFSAHGSLRTSIIKQNQHLSRSHKRNLATSVSASDTLPQIDDTMLQRLGLEALQLDSIKARLLEPQITEQLPGHWKDTHISSTTFFENQNGFKESCLFAPVKFNSTLLDPFRVLHNKAAFYIPHRGFKTKRSHSAGIGSDNKTDDVYSKISSFKNNILTVSNPVALKLGISNNRLKNVLGDEKSTDVQERLKIAFAEGYSASETKQTKWRKNLVRLFWIGVIVFINLQILQLLGIVGGDIKPLAVLKGDRFEISPEDITVKFEDVCGADEAKQELQDVVEYLRDPDKFRSLGAKLPKGVLLVGPPGIGKTLLARAVAGEAGVAYFHASGSEFDEMYVGMGARRVRQLFDAAKLRAPCVIFIDEIDTVGAKRTSSQIHPYANQTINQLLSEMDGFQKNEGIIVLGATNRRDNLDQALLRPGRFDVEVRVFPPDLKGRLDILNLYLKNVEADSDIDVEKIAKGTTGCTGADLENIVNQAALKAAMDGSSSVTHEHMDYAKDKILMGPAKQKRIPDEDCNWMTAYHEAGHTLVALYTKDAVPLHKVTIVPRGMSLGHTSFIPEKESYNQSKSQLLAAMDVAMGGRVAEEIIYGADYVTTGAGSDFSNATRIATAMVKKYGMSEKVGVRVFDDNEGVDSGLSFVKVNDSSTATVELVDSEIKRLLQESYERARTILRAHAQEHRKLAHALMKHETLDAGEVCEILNIKSLKR